MTVIVYRDGVLAGDTALWVNNVIMGHMTKVYRTPAGYLVGSSGASNTCDAFLKWANEGFTDGQAPPPVDKDDAFGAIVVYPDGRVAQFTGRMEGSIYDVPFLCEGSGLEFALGCLYSGKSAVETVQMVIDHTDYGGGTVVSVALAEHPANEEDEDIGHDPFAIPMIEDAMDAHRKTWRDERGLT